ncbi:MAG TPA: DUF3300 domain-containing protein, partial [Casimicrobiaceae bacterium]|nr:DUF3300 domain-containing protein [Casimicrobiaceae bacterium]
MNLSRSLTAIVATVLLVVSAVAPAQNVPPPGTPPPAPPMSQDYLDGLLAPIALFPDELLSQVLMASTYPLEVVQAARFVKANPNLKGDALDAALKDMPWDASVLSLASFPQVLDMMNDKLDWTQRLGDAFLDDEAAVMRTVQGLRMRAQQAGNLQSTEQQKVIVQQQTIIIQPAQPQYVFVPVYNPQVIFGPWWGPPAYLPWYWFPPPIWGFGPRPPNWGFSAGFFWGTAWRVNNNNWGWAQPNWRTNNINININNNNVWVNRPDNRDRVRNNNGNWTHNVDHRRGVAYRDSATNDRFRPGAGSGAQSRENYRGRDNASRPGGGGSVTRPGNERPGTGGGGTVTRPGNERPGTGGGGTVTRPGNERPGTGGSGDFTRPGNGRPGADGGVNATRPGGTDRPVSGGNNMARPTTPTMPTTRPSQPGSRPQSGFQPETRPQ